jgi:signal transduction histidine kinase
MSEPAPPKRSRPWRSVRWRITLVATVLVGVTLAVAAYALVSTVEGRLTDQAKRDADQALDQAAGAMARGERIDVLGIPVGGPAVQVLGPDGRVITRTPGVAGNVLFTVGADGNVVPVSGIVASRYAIVQRTISSPGGDVRIVAFSPLEEVRRSVRALASSLWIGIPLLVLVVGVVAWLLVGRALRPVERLRREVESIGDTTLHRRVDEPATGDEIERLAHTMNGMLDRLDAAQTKQRQFVSDASHELRSPLATIRTSVEVASLHPQRADWPGVASTVLHESERLDELVDDLLALAKLDETTNGDGHQGQPVDLDEIVLNEVTRLRGLGYTVRADGVSAARVEGDPRQLARLVRNLLDNAARHALHAVTVSLTEQDGDARLRVDDDGPGIAPVDRERVFERFTRLDEGRTRSAGGAGLGLSLVMGVAVRHGGTVTVVDAPGGGARFDIRLPMAEVDAPVARRLAR